MKCASCQVEVEGPSRKGLCHKCYCRELPRKPPATSTCHPELNAYRKGLCTKCYKAQKPFKPASCHPELPAESKGLCQNCYQKQWITPEYRKAQNAKPEAIAARKKYASTERGMEAARASQQRNDPDGERVKKRSRESYLRNRDEILKPERVRGSNLAKLGITIEDYEAMLVRQDGKCGLCGASESGGRSKAFHVDHNHKTGQVRALLCARCNPGLGFFNDDPGLLWKAIEYLQKHSTPEARPC